MSVLTASDPHCITGVMVWIHGTYSLNDNGSMTLSQRKASGEVMPTVDGKPPRVATTDASASDLTGSEPKLSYTIPVRPLRACSDPCAAN